MPTHGVPAPVVAQYLRENRIVPEKNDLNSLLFLLTPGVESSKAGTLLSALVAFKRLHDDNAPLEEVMPEFVAAPAAALSRAAPARPVRRDARLLSRRAALSALQRGAVRAGASAGARSMPPQEAVRQLTRNKVDYLPIDESTGASPRRCGVVYPPGIATIVPGERLGARARPMLDYLKMFERSANLFPGFEAEIQGVYREIEADGSIRFYTYVMRE